ncbi:MAG: hypothetical protein H6742_03060 [Alphaproteobacteria bacterium]|nr:hypothetical protein [Alphaproteobacteria bacterium]
MSALTLATVALLGSGAASADGGKLAVHGWAEGGLEVDLSSEAPTDEARYGAALTMARLAAAYDYADGFSAKVQVDGASGTVKLLDAVARVGGRKQPHLDVGRFKVPLSNEYLTAAPELVMPTRMLLNGLSPTRAVGVAGALPWQAGEEGAQDGAVTVGGFDAIGSVPQVGVGGVLVGAVDQGLAHLGHAHLGVHVAVAAWLHPDDLELSIDDPEVLAAAPDHDRWGDLALEAHGGGWTVEVEGLASQARADAHWDGGVGVLAAHRWDLGPGPFQVEPALAYDALQVDAELVHRPALALNLHRDDWHLVETVAYEAEVETSSGGVIHIGRASLQAGF